MAEDMKEKIFPFSRNDEEYKKFREEMTDSVRLVNSSESVDDSIGDFVKEGYVPPKFKLPVVYK